MAKSMMSLWSRFVPAIVLIVMASQAPARADTLVTVEFQGTGFSGSLVYDQSQTGVQQGANYVFQFKTENMTHALAYTVGDPVVGSSGINKTCEPFTITASGTTFTVTGTVPQQNPPTTVTVVLNTNVSVSSTILPFCFSGSTPVFQQTGKFTTVNQSTGATFSGDITWTSCSERISAAVPFPAPAPCPVYTCAAPPCPVYACPPRQTCCLTRFFARLSHRNCCR
jgi:hypothetical protein